MIERIEITARAADDGSVEWWAKVRLPDTEFWWTAPGICGARGGGIIDGPRMDGIGKTPHEALDAALHAIGLALVRRSAKEDIDSVLRARAVGS